MTFDPPRAARLPVGDDDEAPYDDADLSTYPEWWRENIETFRRHGMRPYRPSRFADGEVVADRIETLEAELGVTIDLRTADAEDPSTWVVAVDGRAVSELPRRRTSGGFTRYELDAATFERRVRRSLTHE